MNATELKARAYELIIIIETAKNELVAINQELQKQAESAVKEETDQ
jgi:hypothetical protein